ncbi:hypothetical protein GCM10020256_38920 [Streptomyces thermocoprophilus]
MTVAAAATNTATASAPRAGCEGRRHQRDRGDQGQAADQPATVRGVAERGEEQQAGGVAELGDRGDPGDGRRGRAVLACDERQQRGREVDVGGCDRRAHRYEEEDEGEPPFSLWRGSPAGARMWSVGWLRTASVGGLLRAA